MLILCDLDGTLIDSAPRHLAVLCDLLSRRGLPPADEGYLAFKREGRNTRAYLEAKGIGDPEIREEICRDWAARIEEERYLLSDRWILPRCREVEALRGAGHRIVILSARQNRAWIESRVSSRFPWLQKADIRIVSPLRAGAEKGRALRELAGDGPGILIGDTEADWAACQGTRVHPWMLDTGFRSRDFWRRQGIPSHDRFPTAEQIESLAGAFRSRAEDPGKEHPLP